MPSIASMVEAISYELRERAEELYVIDGLTLEQVAAETGISIQTLKRWSSKEDWFKRRREYREDKQGLRASLTELRNKMLERAVTSLDPQNVYPVIALEKLLGGAGKKAGEPEIPDKPMTKEELLTFIRKEIYGLR
jgi:transposase-like protein